MLYFRLQTHNIYYIFGYVYNGGLIYKDFDL